MEDWTYDIAHDQHLPPHERLRSTEREPGLLTWLGHVAWWSGIGFYLRCVHRLQIHGAQHLPREGPFVMVANHASHLDAVVLATALPLRLRADVFPVAAGDTFFERPLTSLFSVFALNALPVWRRKMVHHAIQALRRKLQRERCVLILFPEGTRSRTGQVAEFKAGLGMLVAGTAAPVVPCWIDGTFAALPPGRRMPRPARLSVRIGPPLDFVLIGNDRAGWESAAARAQDAVSACRGGPDDLTAEGRRRERKRIAAQGR